MEGTYLLDVAAHRRDGTPYDYHRGLYSFRVKSRIKDVGVYRPAHRWAFAGGARARAARGRGRSWTCTTRTARPTGYPLRLRRRDRASPEPGILKAVTST